MSARYEADAIQFQQAGRGPLRKTYTYDPTKQAPPRKTTQLQSAAMAAKKI